LAEYDYSKGGAYFITICTRNSDPILANTQKTDVNVGVALAATHLLDMPPNPEPDSALRFKLMPIGKIVDRNWRMLSERFPMVTLDEYVIMPNHFHGILFSNESDKPEFRDGGKRVGARPTPIAPKTPINPTLGMIVGSFKSMSVKDVLAYIKENRLDMIGKI
jgi:putative transposase